MIYQEPHFIEAVSESFEKYQEHGARSNEKLKPLHLEVAKLLKEIWHESNYKIHYLGDGSKEIAVEGKYYPKNIDICVTDNKKPIFCLGIKFVTSNYKQNANNYFENMMGETANIQAVKDLPYAQLIVLRYETPYYKKGGEVMKTEIINEKDIQKYLNLVFDFPQAHRPFGIGVLLTDINEETASVSVIKPETVFKSDFAKLMNEKLSLEGLFREIQTYRNFLIHKAQQEK
jgi:hypothetical protein